jgi:AAA domain-containing protein
MLALNLSLALAAGKDFLGLRVFKRATVLFVEAEGNETHFRERVGTAARSMGLDTAVLAVHMVKQPDLFEIGGPTLAAAIEQYRPDLVVLDTIGYFFSGEENSSSDWKRLVSKLLRKIGRMYGVAFLLIQHLGKQSETRTGKARIRGSSAQSGDSDTTLTLDRAKSNPETDRILSFEKVKNGPRLAAKVLRFDEPLALFSLTGGDAVVAGRPQLGEVQSIVFEHAPIRWTPLRDAIVGSLQVSRSTAESLIRAALENGLIELSDSVYRPPDSLLPFVTAPGNSRGPDPVPRTLEPHPYIGGEVFEVPSGVTSDPQLRSFEVAEVGILSSPSRPCRAFLGADSMAPCAQCGDPLLVHHLEATNAGGVA